MTTMPSADFCAAINRPYERLSPDAPDTTQISRGKFDRLRRTPAESTETELDGYGLRGRRPARPPETASYPVLVHRAATVAPRFLQTPPRGGSPCASLALHLHQVVQGTCTPRLSNMLGTPTVGQPFRLHPHRAHVSTQLSLSSTNQLRNTPAPKHQSRCGCQNGQHAERSQEPVVEILSLAVVHDVQHPEEIEQPPGPVPPLEHFTGHRADVVVRVFRVVQNDLVHGQQTAAKFQRRILID